MFKLFDKKIINWVLGCSIYMTIAVLTFCTIQGYYTYYRGLLGFIFDITIFFIFFLINYIFIIKIGNLKTRYILLSILFSTLLLIYVIFGDYYIQKKYKYNVSAEYVEAVVVDFKDSYYSCTRNSKCRRIGNWAKYKLISSNDIVRLYDVPKNSIGDKISLVKLTYYEKKGNDLFIRYKPENFKVKYFSRNEENIYYYDLINGLKIKLNLSVFGDNKVGFSKYMYNDKLNFSILSDLEFSKQLPNFSKDFFKVNDYYGIQKIYNTIYQSFLIISSNS